MSHGDAVEPRALAELRVLHLIDSLGSGGAEQSLVEFLPLLAAQDITSVVITMKPADTNELTMRLQGIAEIVLLRGAWIDRLRTLRTTIRRSGAHIVHTSLFYPDVMGRIAALGSGVPVLTSLVNTPYDRARYEDPGVRRRRLRTLQAVDSVTARTMCHHFHAVTHEVGRSAVRNLGIRPDHVTVVERGRSRSRLGYPSHERRIATRRALGITDQQLFLLSVGRQEYQKGHVVLVDALGELCASGIDAVLAVAGRPGSATTSLKTAAASLPDPDRVRFLGYRPDVPDLLCAADVFVFPSRYEGTGGALIEAMAMEVPIVATDLPTLREVTSDGETAILFRPESVPDLVAGIRAVIDDPGLASRLRRRSREVFEDKFTIDRSARRMRRLFHEIARR
ncbi:MAG: glycosyltransferase [Acidobacteria bacterium]|nr:glycosyltransferase [Acidobacteriota bacterium]